MHTRPEGGVLRSPALPRAVRLHGPRRRGQRRAESYTDIPSVRVHMYPEIHQLTCNRANAFIEQAIAQNGRVLVHCNGQDYSGTSFNEGTSLISRIYRWNQPLSSICGHVCHAAYAAELGGRSSHGAKPTILHITEWRISDTNQGVYEYFSTFRSRLRRFTGIRVHL